MLQENLCKKMHMKQLTVNGMEQMQVRNVLSCSETYKKETVNSDIQMEYVVWQNR